MQPAAEMRLPLVWYWHNGFRNCILYDDFSVSVFYVCLCTYIPSSTHCIRINTWYMHTCLNQAGSYVHFVSTVRLIYSERLALKNQVKVHSFFLLCYSSQLPQPVSVVWADWIICVQRLISPAVRESLLIWCIHENWSYFIFFGHQRFFYYHPLQSGTISKAINISSPLK